MLALLLLMLPAPAMAERQEPPPDHTQFLLIVDDSKSMDTRPPHTDRDRLAILASRAFLSFLADEDRVMVVGMNALAAKADSGGDSLQPPQLPSQASVPGGLERYDGGNTPCKTALEGARKLLNAWHERDAKARQVVLFLSDGKCTEEPTAAGEWIGGLKRARAGHDEFYFYLVQFFRTDFDPGALASYTRQTSGHGRQFKVKADGDAAHAIVKAFADVFADALGCPVRQVRPGGSLRCCTRAERVRVLAIRSGRADFELNLEAKDPDGNAVKPVSSVSKAHSHRRGRKAYRYKVVTLVPGDRALTIKSPSTRLLVVPDYRQLRAELSVVKDACPQQSDAPLNTKQDVDSVTAGDTVCVQAALRSSRGLLSPRTDLPFVAAYRQRPGRTEERFAREQAMVERLDGFTHTLITEPGMDLELQARVRYTSSESGKVLNSSNHPLNASTRQWSVKPLSGGKWEAGRLDMGTVHAGDDVEIKAHFQGNFPGELNVTLATLDDLKGHPCLEFVTVKGEETLQVGPGQKRELRLLSRRCRRGGTLEGALLFDHDHKGLNQARVPVTLVFVATPWWAYYGFWVLLGLGSLFGLITLICFINGWRKPARALPRGRLKLAYFFCRDPRLLEESASEYAFPDERRGAYAINPHIKGSGGWYRNAALRLGQGGSRLPHPNLPFDLELQPGPGEFRLAVSTRGTAVHKVTEPALAHRSEDAFMEELLPAEPAATLERRVGSICRLYARLFGRMPAVYSLRIDRGYWYRVGGEGARFFFKIDDSPF